VHFGAFTFIQLKFTLIEFGTAAIVREDVAIS